jgi:hypothetical protein
VEACSNELEFLTPQEESKAASESEPTKFMSLFDPDI